MEMELSVRHVYVVAERVGESLIRGGSWRGRDTRERARTQAGGTKCRQATTGLTSDPITTSSELYSSRE